MAVAFVFSKLLLLGKGCFYLFNRPYLQLRAEGADSSIESAPEGTSNLYVEAEVHDVAVTDDIVLSLKAELSSFLDFLL